MTLIEELRAYGPCDAPYWRDLCARAADEIELLTETANRRYEELQAAWREDRRIRQAWGEDIRAMNEAHARVKAAERARDELRRLQKIDAETIDLLRDELNEVRKELQRRNIGDGAALAAARQLRQAVQDYIDGRASIHAAIGPMRRAVDLLDALRSSRD